MRGDVTANVRVLLLEVPQLVRDVLGHAISAASDLELIAEPTGLEAERSGATVPDVVVCALRRDWDLSRVTPTLWRWPRCQLLLIAVDGDTSLCRLVPQCTTLGALSPADIVDAIRAAVRRRDAECPDGGTP
jgi:DNA-binding NarL/FixJ family response regulator